MEMKQSLCTSKLLSRIYLKFSLRPLLFSFTVSYDVCPTKRLLSWPAHFFFFWILIFSFSVANKFLQLLASQTGGR